jgi:hypothetical protein
MPHFSGVEATARTNSMEQPYSLNGIEVEINASGTSLTSAGLSHSLTTLPHLTYFHEIHSSSVSLAMGIFGGPR